jgi:hypothetical protein
MLLTVQSLDTVSYEQATISKHLLGHRTQRGAPAWKCSRNSKPHALWSFIPACFEERSRVIEQQDLAHGGTLVGGPVVIGLRDRVSHPVAQVGRDPGGRPIALYSQLPVPELSISVLNLAHSAASCASP